MIASSVAHPQAIVFARQGLLALQRGHYRASTALLTRAVQLDPMLGEAWRWLAALHSGAKRAVCLQWAQRSLPHATVPRLPKPIEPVVIAPTPIIQRRRPMRRVAVVAGGAMLAATLAFGSFEYAYAQKVYPGVQAFGHSLSGMSANDVAATLTPQLSAWSGKNLVISLGSQQAIVPLSQLADFAPSSVAQQVLNIGREGSSLEQISAQGTMLFQPSTIAVALDPQRVEHVLATLAGAIDRQPVAASFARNADGSWRIVPDQAGVLLDRNAAIQQVQNWWSRVDWNNAAHGGNLTFTLANVPAQRTTAQLAPYLATLNRQTSQPLVLDVAGTQTTFDRTELLDLTTLPAANAPFAVKPAAVQLLVSDIAQQHNHAPQPSKLVRVGNRATEWHLGQNGITLDQPAAVKSITSALQSGESMPLSLAFGQTPPPAGDLEALGITGIVGQGKSQFASYSAPNRDANVIAGGNEFDGLLVAPGELLSFTTTVGDITPEKGYQMGEMIAGGMVVPSYGGGICQVSTTLFRAAFWAGLPIEERHNHSWRLAWYEADAPAGMDATIALGGPDLKIRNNTDAYLLIDVETDTVNKTQTFTLYGTPRTQDVALIDTWDGAGGIVITRQIKQNGAVVREDSWISYYSQ